MLVKGELSIDCRLAIEGRLGADCCLSAVDWLRTIGRLSADSRLPGNSGLAVEARARRLDDVDGSADAALGAVEALAEAEGARGGEARRAVAAEGVPVVVLDDGALLLAHDGLEAGVAVDVVANDPAAEKDTQNQSSNQVNNENREKKTRRLKRQENRTAPI